MLRFVGIDPSTKLGIVILDEQGEVVEKKEITSKATDPLRMIEIARTVKSMLRPGDIVGIEGFAYGAKGNAVGIMYGLGWVLRTSLHEKYGYTEVAPTAVKKFASGKGTTKKDELSVHVYKRWGFEHKSDNVRDAYVIAQIVKALHDTEGPFNIEGYYQYQYDVLETIKAAK